MDEKDKSDKTLGLHWIGWLDEGEEVLNGFEIVAPADYPQDKLVGKIVKAVLEHWEGEWKVRVDVHVGHGKHLVMIEIKDRDHGMKVVKYYYNLILFGEPDLAYIQDIFKTQSWFEKEPF
jgi:hypothetical protein